MEWLKMYSRGLLYGTTANMTDSEQATWFKLLAIANETKFRDGSLRFGIGQPMPLTFIATLCHRTVEQVEACIEAYKQDVNTDDSLSRIQIWDDGTLFITNFEKYQATPEGKGKAKEAYKEQSKARARDRQNTLDTLRREVNRLNQNITAVGKKLRYVERDGAILDTETGAVVPFSKGGE